MANRLAGETSPYLLQHAENPVDWYPWGEEALKKAASEDLPILLSVGYSACHWCHVMERESFEDPQVAEVMNANFISIKVDREERPDIDAIYMDAVQAMSGHGGWPMTVFLTPDGRPFFGGTYFPPKDSHGLPSFTKVLLGIAKAWEESRGDVEVQSKKLLDALRRSGSSQPSNEPLTDGLASGGASTIGRSFDKDRAGFGGPPKFPQAPVLEFMLSSGGDAASQALATLDAMAAGGIYDQLGGGFHRYSVDAEWLVPHFEKMLYDNAQLASVYVHAWQLTKKDLYRRIATETLEYLLRDMMHPEGGFYSAEDADSEGVEGRFYVWNLKELTRLAPNAADYYSVTKKGNFEGTNILTAASLEPPDPEARAALLESRSGRVRPSLDDKVLVSWNGLALKAFAEAGAAFSRPDLTEAAQRCAGFILSKMRNGGRLMRSYKDGKARILGMLEDYAWIADGLFILWEATLEPKWFRESLDLTAQMLDLFWDSESEGLFSTASDHEELIVRRKELIENATPAPAGVAAGVLLKLGDVTGSDEFTSKGAAILRMARAFMEQAPHAVPTYLSNLGLWLSAPKEVVVMASSGNPADTDLFRTVWSTYIPNRILAGGPPGINVPLMEGKTALGGKTTAFVCERFACQRPANDLALLSQQLLGAAAQKTKE